MKLKQVTSVTQSDYIVVDQKGNEVDENMYLECQVNNLVILTDKKGNSKLAICIVAE